MFVYRDKWNELYILFLVPIVRCCQRERQWSRISCGVDLRTVRRSTQQEIRDHSVRFPFHLLFICPLLLPFLIPFRSFLPYSLLLIIIISHKWTGTSAGTSVILELVEPNQSGTRYMPALDCYLPKWRKYRIHALTVRRHKIFTRVQRRRKNIDSLSKSNPLLRRRKKYYASTWRQRRHH